VATGICRLPVHLSFCVLQSGREVSLFRVKTEKQQKKIKERSWKLGKVQNNTAKQLETSPLQLPSPGTPSVLCCSCQLRRLPQFSAAAANSGDSLNSLLQLATPETPLILCCSCQLRRLLHSLLQLPPPETPSILCCNCQLRRLPQFFAVTANSGDSLNSLMQLPTLNTNMKQER
jgi:hypothetical protein